METALLPCSWLKPLMVAALILPKRHVHAALQARDIDLNGHNGLQTLCLEALNQCEPRWGKLAGLTRPKSSWADLLARPGVQGRSALRLSS